MEKAIYFDMDGTIADLYGVEGWLDCLEKSNYSPFVIARPMFDEIAFAKLLNELKRKGYHIGIVSWTSKHGTKQFNKRVADCKRFWLKEHIFTVFDEIKIVPYGTPKSSVVKYPDGILFDDEENNRGEWHGTPFPPSEIEKVLTELL